MPIYSILVMRATNNLHEGGSGSSTEPQFVAHEVHIHFHHGIIKEVDESVIRIFPSRRRAPSGFWDKLKFKHGKPHQWEYEVEHREHVGTIGELQELDTIQSGVRLVTSKGKARAL